jgi:hypothetical protein
MLNSHGTIGFIHDLFTYNRRDVVRPALHGKYFLAPTTKQRLRYKNYLSVYGKDKVNVSENMRIMVEKFHVCHISTTAYFNFKNWPLSDYCE